LTKETLDRKTPPPIHEVTSLIFPYPSVYYLDNGIPVYETRLGTQEIMKIEVVFMSGRPHEHKRLVSRTTARMLREGTKSYTSATLAERIDFYAGTVQTPVNLDTGSLVLYCMTKHFAHLVPLIAEILHEPTFPEKELKTYIDNNIQTLLVDLSKNDVLAYRKITELIFGENHPYGYNSTPDDYRALSQADLVKHHKEHFTSDNCLIFLSGKIDESIIKLLNQYLGQKKTVSVKNNKTWEYPVQKPVSIKVKNDDTLQAAIRIGRQFGNRSNPDFDAFFVLNTILGGYFSSRLMTNIREKKGYTYNIYSALDLMIHDGYFYISSEVGNKFVKKAIAEIYTELEKLQREPVSSEELKMVQNYLMGNMLNMIDGPFAVSDVIKSFVTEGVDLSRFQHFVDTVRSITPQQIQVLAQKYLNKEDMFEVVVGV
jgi:zinc protease